MLDRSDLKKYAECTSQRLNWTSGARVMTFLFVFCILSDLNKNTDFWSSGEPYTDVQSVFKICIFIR